MSKNNTLNVHACPPPPDKKVCNTCINLIPTVSQFCGKCGASQELNTSTPDVKKLKHEIIYSLGYYFSILFLIFFISTIDISYVTDNIFTTDIAFIIITLGFAVYRYKEILPSILKPVKPGMTLLMIIAMTGFAFVVSFGFEMIPVFKNNSGNYFYKFANTAHPIIYMLISTALVPGIFEELAFRGFIYNSLTKVMSIRATIWVTALLFTILHISPISFLFITPIGIFFAFLRMKYGHIWYGVIGHFTYNTSICLIDYYQYYY